MAGTKITNKRRNHGNRREEASYTKKYVKKHIKKQTWKAGNMLYPLPAVLVSVGDRSGRVNALTVAWTGTICTNPAMVYISVRPERYSYDIIRESGEFVINLTTCELAYATDFCGVRSGRELDKLAACGLTCVKSNVLQYAPRIEQCPVNIECTVTAVEELGSHHMFLAEVRCVHVAEQLLDESGGLMLERAGLLAYCHGRYVSLGEKIGRFGWSVKKTKMKTKNNVKTNVKNNAKTNATMNSKMNAKRDEKHAAKRERISVVNTKKKSR